MGHINSINENVAYKIVVCFDW